MKKYKSLRLSLQGNRITMCEIKNYTFLLFGLFAASTTTQLHSAAKLDSIAEKFFPGFEQIDRISTVLEYFKTMERMCRLNEATLEDARRYNMDLSGSDAINSRLDDAKQFFILEENNGWLYPDILTSLKKRLHYACEAAYAAANNSRKANLFLSSMHAECERCQAELAGYKVAVYDPLRRVSSILDDAADHSLKSATDILEGTSREMRLYSSPFRSIKRFLTNPSLGTTWLRSTLAWRLYSGKAFSRVIDASAVQASASVSYALDKYHQYMTIRKNFLEKYKLRYSDSRHRLPIGTPLLMIHAPISK